MPIVVSMAERLTSGTLLVTAATMLSICHWWISNYYCQGICSCKIAKTIVHDQPFTFTSQEFSKRRR
jgi:hypothetical protein